MRRKTPLKQGDKPLKRTAWFRSKPAEREPKKTPRPRETGPKTTVKDLVKQRAGYSCEICSRHLGEHGGQIHHRHGRQMGGNKQPWINLPSNLMYLCPECHEMVTDTQGNRTEYEAKGWLLRANEDPLDRPIELWGGQLVRLNNDGGPRGYWQPHPDDMPVRERHDSQEEDAA